MTEKEVNKYCKVECLNKELSWRVHWKTGHKFNTKE